MSVRLILSLFFIMAAMPAYALDCEPRLPPEITISIDEKPVVFDAKTPAAELSKQKSDTVSPLPSSFHAETGGLITNVISLGHNITFGQVVFGKDKKACLWFKKIDITLRMEPKIYIANDYQDKPCWYASVFDHESKHLDIDRRLLADHAQRFKEYLTLLYTEHPRDYTANGVAVKKQKAMQKTMDETLTATLKVLFDSMMSERGHLQQELDSYGEYAHINFNCNLREPLAVPPAAEQAAGSGP